MAKRKTIGEHARDVVIENHRDSNTPRDNWHIAWDDSDTLHEIANRAGVKVKSDHPIDIRNAVLAGIDRSPMFRKSFYRVNVGWGGYGREARCRIYFLKPEYIND